MTIVVNNVGGHIHVFYIVQGIKTLKHCLYLTFLTVLSKVKVKLFLFLTKYHAMKKHLLIN